MRVDKFDTYDNLFENSGLQPIKNYELYFSGDLEKDKETYGFDGYGNDYRTGRARSAGAIRANAGQEIPTGEKDKDGKDILAVNYGYNNSK